MPGIDSEMKQNTLVPPISATITQEHKDADERQNLISAKTLPRPSKIPKPPPGFLLSKASNSEISKEYKTASAIPKAPGIGISNETKVVLVGADKQSKKHNSVRKSKNSLSKAATGHADTVLQEKHMFTEADKRLNPHRKSQEISIIELNGVTDSPRKSRESLAGHGDKRADTLQKARETAISNADKRSALRKSKESSIKAASPESSQETIDLGSESHKPPRKLPNELFPKTGIHHKIASSASTRKVILCSECRAAVQTTVCFIANDGRVVACRKGSLGHVLHCKYPWCLTNDPNYVDPCAVQPKNYLISKRHLLKSQTASKSRSNRMTSNATEDQNEASNSQSSLTDKPVYGIEAWEDDQSCSKSSSVTDQKDTCSQSTDSDGLLCGIETWENDQSCSKINSMVCNSMEDQNGTSSNQFTCREQTSCGIETWEDDQSCSKSNPMAYIYMADQNETSSEFNWREESPYGIETSGDDRSCIDDGTEFILSGDTYSALPDIKSKCWAPIERNGDYSMVTAAGLAEIAINDQNYFDSNGGESLEIKINDCYICESNGSTGSESLEIKSNCGVPFKKNGDYRTTASELAEIRINDQNSFDSNVSESLEIKGNGCNFCDSNSSTSCESPEIKCNSQTSSEGNTNLNFKSHGIQSNGWTPLERSSGIGVELHEAQSNSWTFLEGNGDIDIENNCLTSFDSNNTSNGGMEDESPENKTDNWISDCIEGYSGSTDSELLEMEMYCLASSASNDDYQELSDERRSSWANRRQRSGNNITEQQEAETVRLKKQLAQERKQAGEYLLDNAMEEEIHKLAPDGETRVKIIVEAFEKIISHNERDIHHQPQQQHSVGDHELSLPHTHIAMHC